MDLIFSIAGSVQLSEVKELNISNRDITVLEPDVLSKCINLESLNISGNRLKEIPNVSLPKLVQFNCEDNMIKDITPLKNFPNLCEVYITGNPLSSADRYIAVSLLPKLRQLDGRNCNKLREADERMTQQIYPQAMSIWEDHFKHKLNTATDEGKHNSLVKQFIQMVNHTTKCHDMPKLYKLFKVQAIVTQILEKTNGDSGQWDKSNNSILQKSPRKRTETRGSTNVQTPSKNSASPLANVILSPARRSPRISTPLSKSNSVRKTVQNSENPYLCTPKSKRKLFDVINEGSSPKKIPKDVSRLDFDPRVFIRCHSRNNDPGDNATQVWRAVFEPDINELGCTTNIVATCGGDTVCLIDCSSGSVLKRYKHFNEHEDFYALAWSVVQLKTQHETHTTILATAGKGKEIVLIHPLQLMCYDVFKAHNKPINCLLFHPSHSTWLLSGSVGGKIHLWEVGVPSLPYAKVQHKKLLTLEAKEDVLQLAFHAPFSVLLAGTDEGLLVWNIPSEFIPKCKDLIPATTLTASQCKHDETLVDGLAFISEDKFCLKYSRTGTIYICSLQKTLAGFKSQSHTKTIKLHILLVLTWKKCEVDYIYIGSHLGAGILASGDNEGRLWVYDVKRILDSNKSNCNFEEPEPPTVVLEWPEMDLAEAGNIELDLKSGPFKTIINSVGVSSSAEYLVTCAEKNLVCIWKQVDGASPNRMKSNLTSCQESLNSS